jgi:hypothetical protein
VFHRRRPNLGRGEEGANVRRIATVVLAAVLVAACAVEPVAQPEPTPVPTPAPPPEPEPEPEPEPPTQEPVTVTGIGSINSAPFDLIEGDYLATFTLDDDCLYFLHLSSVSEGARGQEIAYERRTAESENYLYGIPAGTYAVESSTSREAPRCAWSVTLEVLALP